MGEAGVFAGPKTGNTLWAERYKVFFATRGYEYAACAREMRFFSRRRPQSVWNPPWFRPKMAFRLWGMEDAQGACRILYA